jgi:hypothetical protein
MNYEKRYKNVEKTDYDIFFVDDKRIVKIEETNPKYINWLTQISGYNVSVIDGVLQRDSNGLAIKTPVYNTPKEVLYVPPQEFDPELRFAGLNYDKKIAEIVAYRMDKLGYSQNLCLGIMASTIKILQTPEEDRTEADLQRLAEANGLETVRQQIIQQVYLDYPLEN